MTTLQIVFWIFAFIVFYTFIGYGIVLFILVKIKELFKKKNQDKLDINHLPRVTLLIAAYNEENIIDSKMDNSFQLDYPSDLLDIVWVTDGSNDNTNTLLEKYLPHSEGKPSVKILFQKERGGKTAALNRAVPLVESPIIVFTDANTMICSEAIKEIVLQFQNPKVGCVAGEKRVAGEDGATASEGIYWKYESFLKEYDWRLNSAVGAAGELYAIRRELFKVMPADTLLDDFILSMKIAEGGHKIAYCSKAYAIEGTSKNMKEEKKRKVRIAAGGLQSIIRLPNLWNCFKHPTLSFQYVSHRVLRWSITPIVLLALLPINVVLAFWAPYSLIYLIILFFQILFYILGLVGNYLAEKEIKNKYLYIPYYFLFMNLNVINGLFYLKKHKGKAGIWEKAERK